MSSVDDVGGVNGVNCVNEDDDIININDINYDINHDVNDFL